VNSERLAKIGVPIALVVVVIMMVVPLPPLLLDMLLAFNITFSVVILLTSMYVKRALDFAVFPSLLLVATMFRLALNVSATRLVLTHGEAGKVIEAFGHFVVGGSLIVGLVIFLILVIIQFMVITNGSGRVAEVAARFTLDAMPGKQMAIDADLAAGAISDAEAKQRRKDVSAEADFYGAMDGASKFVKGDAMAAIVITLINLIGGFLIGVIQKGMPMGQAVETYSLLSIGDGLVSQLPALLISISTGLIVTRAASSDDMGTDLVTQFSKQGRALRIAGGAMACLALIPGIPKLPFLVIGVGAFLLGRKLGNGLDDVAEDAATLDLKALEAPAEPAPDSPEGIVRDMKVEPLELELAFDVVELVDNARGGDLLDRVKALRRKLALELGVIIPLVRTRDNLDLPPSVYTISIHGVEVARGSSPAGTVLVIGDDLSTLPGEATVEPVFGLPAKWIPQEYRNQAEIEGHTVVDRSSVITTHLAEVVRQNAGRLLSHQDIKMLMDVVKQHDPVVIDELNGATMALGEIQRVLANLLNENIPIRDLGRIFEVLSERGRQTKDPEVLTEAVRSGLGPAVSAVFAQGNRLPVITFEPMLEHQLLEALRTGTEGSFLALDPDAAEQLSMDVSALARAAEERGDTPTLVCSGSLRPAVRRLIQAAAPRLAVLSYNELGSQLEIETIGQVRRGNPAAV
jgi:flagellar biosynthesis protein FlhA